MLGRNARTVSKHLDRLRAQGNLSEGVPLEHGGMLRIAFVEQGVKLLPPELRGDLADNQLLGVALTMHGRENEVPVVVVTKDTNLRIKADALGIRAEDYESDRVDIEELYRGVREVAVGKEFIDRFYAAGECAPPPGTEGICSRTSTSCSATPPPGRPRWGATTSPRRKIRLLPPMKEDVWGIRPRNKEQHFALDILLDDSVKLVTLAGKAGTGKTLLAIAAGLRKTSDEEVYQRMLVSRPVLPMGKDIGFLPGDVEEKLKPWMQPIFDNVEYLFGSNRKKRQGSVRGYQELMNLGILEIEPLTYIRGRSIPNQFIIVDEAQNLSPARGEDDPHAGRGEQQGGPDGRPVPDRQPLRRLLQQRPLPGGGEVQGRIDRRARAARQGGALPAGGAGGEHPVRRSRARRRGGSRRREEQAPGHHRLHRPILFFVP